MTTAQPALAILDVGHGNSAVLIDTKGVVVIDTGLGSALLEYLTEVGIGRIDVILLSHADEDHIGGLLAILGSGKFEIGRVRLNTDSSKGTTIWDDVLYELGKLQTAGKIDFEVSLVTNQSGEYDQGEVRIEILAPSRYLAGKGPGSQDRQGRAITTNSISAVIRLLRKGQPIAIFPGDLDDVGLQNLLEEKVDVRAAVMVFPHHGGRPGLADVGSFAQTLCQLVSPRSVVFSIGRGRFNTPQPDSVAAVRRTVPDVRIACTQLSEHCAASLPERNPAHLNNVFARGREFRRCCAGTILLDLDQPGSVLPLQTDHAAFISIAAPTALCSKVS